MLKNWRSHANTKVELKKGTNLLIGRMGAGKSSVLNALSYALFGTFPELKARRFTLGDVVRRGQEQAEVKITFNLDEHEYTITRIIEKGTTKKVEIRRDGKLLDVGTKQVNELVKKLLGFDYNTFARAVYAVQNDVLHFIEASPQERKAELDRILGIDKFEEMRKNCVSLRNRIKAIRKALEGEVRAEEIERLEKEIAETEDQLKEEKSALEREKALILALEKEARALWQELEKMREQQKARQALQERLAKLKGTAQALRGKLKDEDREQLNAHLEKIAEKLKELQQKLEEKKQEEAQLYRELEQAQKDLAKAQQQQLALQRIEREQERYITQLKEIMGERSLEELKDRLANLREKQKHLREKQARLLALAKEEKKYLEELSKSENKCPICHSPLSEQKKRELQEKKKARIRSFVEKIRELRTEEEAIGKEIEVNEEKVKEAQELKAKISALERQKPQSRGENLSALQQALKEKKQRWEKCRTEREEQEQSKWNLAKEKSEVEEKISLLEQLSSIEQEVVQITEKLMAISFDEESYSRLTQDYREKSERLTEAKAKAAQLKANIEAKEKMLTRLRQEMERKKKTEEKLQRCLIAEEDLALFHNALLQVQETIRREVIEALNQAMQEVWQALYPHRDYTRVRLAVRENDYRFEMWKEGKWWDAELASGGEKACLALAFRVALAAIFTEKLTWLILDEPTHNLDREAVEALANVLQTSLPKIVEQILVISHDEALIGAQASGTIYIIKKDERGCSEVNEYA